MSASVDFSFVAELWLYQGKAAWYFFSLPPEVADAIAELNDAAMGRRGARGFGSVRVQVQLGDSFWETSLFPDRKLATYLLPVKKQIRLAQKLTPGAIAQLSVRLVNA